MRAAAALLFLALALTARDIKAYKTVIYWESWGAQKLGHFCEAGQPHDILIIAFLYNWTAPVLSAQFSYAAIGTDIKACQAAGKKVLLSLGGGTGSYGLATDAIAKTFSATLWASYFAGGTGAALGTGVRLDGIDLDVEHGTTTGYTALVTDLRARAAVANITLLIGAAPQCIYPDAILGPKEGKALTDAWFDFISVQFYNNPSCSPGAVGFNWNTWSAWGKTSKNPNVLIYLGLPASNVSAGSGYLPIAEIKNTINLIKGSTNFGGVMMWAANKAEANGNIMADVKAYLTLVAAAGPVAPSPGCTGLSCSTITQCRSQYGYCGVGTSYCNSNSQWNASCISTTPSMPAPAPAPAPAVKAPAPAPAPAVKAPAPAPAVKAPAPAPALAVKAPAPAPAPAVKAPAPAPAPAVKAPAAAPAPAPAPTGKCSGVACATGQCRSQWGYCGTTTDFCNALSTWTSACSVAPIGACTGAACTDSTFCRSKYGYCGSGTAYCNTLSIWSSGCGVTTLISTPPGVGSDPDYVPMENSTNSPVVPSEPVMSEITTSGATALAAPHSTLLLLLSAAAVVVALALVGAH